MVTLEPIENEIEEAVDLAFAPAAAASRPRTAARRSQVAAEDAPEPLVGGVVDLGVIATEFLILGIDPYPRKAGCGLRRAGGGRRYRASVCRAGRAQEGAEGGS